MSRRIGLMQVQELRNMISYRVKEEDRIATIALMRTIIIIGIFKIYRDF
jgi:hypothetical protein